MVTETNAELRAKASVYRDILKQSNNLPQQKLIEHCQNKLKETLKKIHNHTVSNSRG
jgi:hypothetical protein